MDAIKKAQANMPGMNIKVMGGDDFAKQTEDADDDDDDDDDSEDASERDESLGGKEEVLHVW